MAPSDWQARIPDHIPVMTDAERETSREATLATRPPGDLWVFGYGSLIWDPRFRVVERRLAVAQGYRRSFCFWTLVSRGTRERPGLGLGLEEDPEGRCAGLAFRLDCQLEEEDTRALWRREMYSGIYRPAWVDLATEEGPVTAVSFIAEPDHIQYAGGFSLDVQAEIIAGAVGDNGPCHEYLSLTVEHLAKVGIREQMLDDLKARVDALLAA